MRMSANSGKKRTKAMTNGDQGRIISVLADTRKMLCKKNNQVT